MYDVFEKLLEEQNVKAAAVAKATGIPPSTFSDWKKGKSKPKDDKLSKIANYFRVDPRVFKDKEPQGFCYDCGFSYVPGYQPDELQHERNHTARENAVKRFGFCWPYAVRENAKILARNKLLSDNLTLEEKIDANIEIMKALFSRSLEASGYSFGHVAFPIYASMLLNQNQFKSKIEKDAYNVLVAKYGVQEGIEEGKTHYVNPVEKKILHSVKKPLTPLRVAEPGPDYNVNTVAAHKDDKIEWTPEELRRIEEYKQLLLAARNSKK